MSVSTSWRIATSFTTVARPNPAFAPVIRSVDGAMQYEAVFN